MNYQKDLEMRKLYNGFLKSAFRSGETVEDYKTFEWFCEDYKRRFEKQDKNKKSL